MMGKLLFIIVGFMVCNKLSGQDTIVKRDNERILCKIKKIELKYIIYKPLHYELNVNINKEQVAKVILASGEEIKFNDLWTEKDYYIDNKKNCLKFTIFSPFFGYTGLSYERNFIPGSSLELSLGIIGLGTNSNSFNPKSIGVTVRLGYKFINSKDSPKSGIKDHYLLSGWYLRPEFILTKYNQPTVLYSSIGIQTYYETIQQGAFLLNLGYQKNFNRVIVDIFFGVGVGITTYPDKINNNPYPYFGYSFVNSNLPSVVSTGFRIGYLF